MQEFLIAQGGISQECVTVVLITVCIFPSLWACYLHSKDPHLSLQIIFIILFALLVEYDVTLDTRYDQDGIKNPKKIPEDAEATRHEPMYAGKFECYYSIVGRASNCCAKGCGFDSKSGGVCMHVTGFQTVSSI